MLEAKSGTGKTAVFAIIALEKLNLNKGLQTLMLAPTREIASQICDVIKTIGAYFQGNSMILNFFFYYFFLTMLSPKNLYQIKIYFVYFQA